MLFGSQSSINFEPVFSFYPKYPAFCVPVIFYKNLCGLKDKSSISFPLVPITINDYCILFSKIKSFEVEKFPLMLAAIAAERWWQEAGNKEELIYISGPIFFSKKDKSFLFSVSCVSQDMLKDFHWLKIDDLLRHKIKPSQMRKFFQLLRQKQMTAAVSNSY